MIQRFDGYIAQYLGDGLLVYFGYPQAHEDDAQRAVRTGLGMVEAMGNLNTTLVRGHGVRLAVRVGIHTGLVVVGEMGSGTGERLALGETPNRARLQGWRPRYGGDQRHHVPARAGPVHLSGPGRSALKGWTSRCMVYQVLGCQRGAESLRGSKLARA